MTSVTEPRADLGPPTPTVAAALAAARQGDLLEAARLASALDSVDQPPEQVLQLIHLRGGIAFELGQLDEAEICFEQVIHAATDQRNPILMAKASTNLGSIAHVRGKAQLAISFYRSALQAYVAADDAVGIAQACHNLSIVLREFGDLRAAAIHSSRATQSAARSGDLGLQATTLGGAAEVAMAQGDLDRARAILVDAARLADLAGDRIGLLELQRLRARIEYQRGRFNIALRDAGRVYLASQRLGAVHLSGECALLASEVASSLRRTRLADSYRRRAQDAYRHLGSPARAEGVTRGRV